MERDSEWDLHMRTTLEGMMTGKTPILAIDSVKIHVNSSTSHNNVVSHRLRIVPFISDEHLNTLEFASNCKCKEHCSKCSVEVTLDVKCTSDEARQVTMADIVSSDPRVFPVKASCTNKCNGDEYIGDILIMTLRGGQVLKLTAYVRKRMGKMQPMFNPLPTFEFVLDAESASLYTLYEKTRESAEREQSKADTNKGKASSDWPVTLGMHVICSEVERPVLCGEAYAGVKLWNPQKKLAPEDESHMKKN